MEVISATFEKVRGNPKYMLFTVRFEKNGVEQEAVNVVIDTDGNVYCGPHQADCNRYRDKIYAAIIHEARLFAVCGEFKNFKVPEKHQHLI